MDSFEKFGALKSTATKAEIAKGILDDAIKSASESNPQVAAIIVEDRAPDKMATVDPRPSVKENIEPSPNEGHPISMRNEDWSDVAKISQLKGAYTKLINTVREQQQKLPEANRQITELLDQAVVELNTGSTFNKLEPMKFFNRRLHFERIRDILTEVAVSPSATTAEQSVSLSTIPEVITVDTDTKVGAVFYYLRHLRKLVADEGHKIGIQTEGDAAKNMPNATLKGVREFRHAYELLTAYLSTRSPESINGQPVSIDTHYVNSLITDITAAYNVILQDVEDKITLREIEELERESDRSASLIEMADDDNFNFMRSSGDDNDFNGFDPFGQSQHIESKAESPQQGLEKESISIAKPASEENPAVEKNSVTTEDTVLLTKVADRLNKILEKPTDLVKKTGPLYKNLKLGPLSPEIPIASIGIKSYVDYMKKNKPKDALLAVLSTLESKTKLPFHKNELGEQMTVEKYLVEAIKIAPEDVEATGLSRFRKRFEGLFDS